MDERRYSVETLEHGVSVAPPIPHRVGNGVRWVKEVGRGGALAPVRTVDWWPRPTPQFAALGTPTRVGQLQVVGGSMGRPSMRRWVLHAGDWPGQQARGLLRSVTECTVRMDTASESSRAFGGPTGSSPSNNSLPSATSIVLSRREADEGVVVVAGEGGGERDIASMHSTAHGTVNYFQKGRNRTMRVPLLCSQQQSRYHDCAVGLGQ
jgi:hypothetical protein